MTTPLEAGPVVNAAVRKRLERLEDGLSPYACRSTRSLGRERPEPACPLRTEFQRDRDRIIHTKAFRRLKHKTQVFIAPTGDHYVTRLTHTLEVAQIARTIARALNLNEDLVEAMAQGHDLGHTPFGHVGEASLDQLCESGFSHSAQSLRIVERLEKDGRGLNLTWEVRQGILSHSKPRGDFLAAGVAESMTLEAQVLRLADSVAYLNHDIADAIRAGVLKVSDLPAEVNRTLGTAHSQRINSLVTDIVEASWAASGEDGGPPGETPVITMSDPVRQAMVQLREYMFEQLYLPLGESEESEVARDMVRLLYGHFVLNPEEVPPPYFGQGTTPQQASVDYLAGMTDHYAIRLAERLQPGISRGVFSGVILV
ncbi:MAG: deoxyguanosinetriphosphate triphosphohydrolase [Dehalococcoidia bacterium]|nr:deoxyguanosinetriphosphate triphosphohydrolase [Dehalococcoidia bacterium]MDP6226962.1 deoxyguanosinetriphosphate triphosphohydrolase [Dehalococcoidia bacterium]MDP7085654.1 deoxyguanosinetriphosphate triphosphohydrolase [Dehalococcoidia bacterium]MDP7202247.1 deoxyguanosinetriphosphate triphosphohydrolase [Dehalococcoidia bacterium]MDP7510401.1 deoxyguanosinetriphosphate triphosphohydrolase [Dehalococcoidia bacterium]